MKLATHSVSFVFYLAISTMTLPDSATASPPGDGGIEIWVDGPAEVQPGNDRNFPDVAVDPDGNSVFIWNTDEIYLRRFNASGEALGDPVQVNTTEENDQRHPRIAMHTDGSFLVVWQSSEPEPIYNGGFYPYIRTQAFNADAQPIGSEQLMYTTSTGSLTNRYPDVAALPGGGYAVVWAQELPVAPETGRGIMARLVSATGAPDGAAFVANSTIGLSEEEPAVTELDDGGFLVVWRSYPNLVGRRFNADGQPLTEDIQLTVPVLFTAKSEPDVVRGVDGRILAVWYASEGISGGEARARMFSPDLVPLGDEFRVNTLTEGSQSHVRAAAYGNFGFLAIWESQSSVGDDPDPSIQGRIVTGNNQFGGAQFQVNKYTNGGQYDPATGGMDGTVSIVWGSQFNELNGNNDVITAQTWSECGIFCDSFE